MMIIYQSKASYLSLSLLYNECSVCYQCVNFSQRKNQPTLPTAYICPTMKIYHLHSILQNIKLGLFSIGPTQLNFDVRSAFINTMLLHAYIISSNDKYF